jgi:hypothetical protein
MMWVGERVKMWGGERVKMWGGERVKMWGGERVKMWGLLLLLFKRVYSTIRNRTKERI